MLCRPAVGVGRPGRRAGLGCLPFSVPRAVGVRRWPRTGRLQAARRAGGGRWAVGRPERLFRPWPGGLGGRRSASEPEIGAHRTKHELSRSPAQSQRAVRSVPANRVCPGARRPMSDPARGVCEMHGPPSRPESGAPRLIDPEDARTRHIVYV